MILIMFRIIYYHELPRHLAIMDDLKSPSKKHEHANFSRVVWPIKNVTVSIELVQNFKLYDSNPAPSSEIISKPLAISSQ